MMMCHNAADFPQGRAWIELDRSALLHNVRVLRALLPKGCELMPAVKANAYGHGAALVAGELQMTTSELPELIRTCAPAIKVRPERRLSYRFRRRLSMRRSQS